MPNIVAEEIRQLATRLNSGGVKFLDVLDATRRHLNIADGEVHYEENPETLKALEDLAEALVKAWEREGVALVLQTCATLTEGVAIGRYGASFFKRIKSK
jgi:hypothetical protein